MGIFSRLFRQPNADSQRLTTHLGVSATSPNGQYVLSWRAGDDAENGYFVLFDGDTAVSEGVLKNPDDGCVADTGTFILNDMGCRDGALEGAFCAFGVDGNPILRCEFKAIPGQNAISRDGRYAVCRTANSDSVRDSGVLVTFGLARRCEIARWYPELWGTQYDLGDDGAYIRLLTSNGLWVRYTRDGDFVDRYLWINHELDHGEIYLADGLLREAEATGNLDPDLLSRVLACADKALHMRQASDPRWCALTFAVKGKSLDLQGNLGAALESYDLALKLNPKIGVKRRAQAIRKRLGGQ